MPIHPGPSVSSQGSTDVSLIDRIKINDPEAWQKLIDWTGRLVLHWCRKLGLGKQDREDVFQEVYLAVFRSMKNFRKEKPDDSFRGWLLQITTNKARDHYRRQRPQAQVELPVIEAALASQARALAEEERAADGVGSQLLLRGALEQLRGQIEERTWQAFWQTAVDGRPAPEVARALAMSADAVRQAKARVLKRLRVEFKELF